ncbi:MAG: peptidase [Clostridium butyricum]|nr:peptidase [Clostridium butyricum]
MKKLKLAAIIIISSLTLVACDNMTNNNGGTTNTSNISIEQAKEIALNHAKLSADQVSFVKSELDDDNGMQKYEIEFYNNNTEYDYEIDPANGKILSYDNEIEDYNNENVTNNNGTTTNESNNETTNSGTTNSGTNPNTVNDTANNPSSISVEKAKEIALNHAGLSANQVSFVKSELDNDDGIQKYEIEFHNNNTEYDYEINAANGEILSYDHDIENYNNGNTTNNNGTNNSGSNSTTTNTNNISVEKAKEIALNHAGLSANQVSFEKSELENDNGVQEYDIEFHYNNKEYSYKINANTGAILSYE